MSLLENAKQYTGSDLENIFFRPILCGPTALDLGVRVLYNMPVPTTVQLWDRSDNVLKKYTSGGWNGSTCAKKLQKTLNLSRVKAEMGFSAANYFSLVYEQISARSDVNMEDLSGTMLEEAETILFKRSISEGIRTTMWLGDSSASHEYNTFDGFLKAIKAAGENGAMYYNSHTFEDIGDQDKLITLLDEMWDCSEPRMQSLRSEGQLAYFVTPDVYFAYEKYLDSKSTEGAYRGTIDGHEKLSYHGIPLIDVRIPAYMLNRVSLPQSFILLTDRRNLVLVVNTADFPGTEVRMWYNPDQMENRQRAVFMIAADVLDESLTSFSYCM